jgi:hypothetical protein
MQRIPRKAPLTKCFCVIAASALLAQSAGAVDYVQCREMLRTKNEMLQKLRSTEGNTLRKYFAINCPEIDIVAYSPEDIKKKLDLVKGNPKCSAEYRDKYLLANKKPAYISKQPIVFPEDGNSRSRFYNPESTSWVKAVEKVTADLRKAGCPYE